MSWTNAVPEGHCQITIKKVQVIRNTPTEHIKLKKLLIQGKHLTVATPAP